MTNQTTEPCPTCGKRHPTTHSDRLSIMRPDARAPRLTSPRPLRGLPQTRRRTENRGTENRSAREETDQCHPLRRHRRRQRPEHRCRRIGYPDDDTLPLAGRAVVTITTADIFTLDDLDDNTTDLTLTIETAVALARNLLTAAVTAGAHARLEETRGNLIARIAEAESHY